MDKIWYRNPSKSEVIGRCGGDEKRMTTQNRHKSNAEKKVSPFQAQILSSTKKIDYRYTVRVFLIQE